LGEDTMKILVTGGAGFIGSNVANALLKDRHSVVIYDNLSRPGVYKNFTWLAGNKEKETLRMSFFQSDIVDYKKLEEAVEDVDVIFHFAGQVGVQSSIDNPRDDFNVNASGTFNVLEAARLSEKHPMVVFASTNKVYGEFDKRPPVSESQPLSFCTPYGCSKGSAGQYVLDYHRIYGLPTVVLRMSCIYGARQFGTEEQGWLAHFMLFHIKKEPITVFGDGTQRRDALFVDDYVDLCKMLIENKKKVAGKVFNIGGGPKNTISVNEALSKMAKMVGKTKVSYTDWRPSDQHTYISDISKIKKAIGWEPKIGIDGGLKRLEEWCRNLR